MKRMYISTIRRIPSREIEQQLDGEHGKVYVLDWETGKLLVEPKTVNPVYDLEVPQGKSHGARGLCIFNNCLYVAGSDNKITLYNLDTFSKIKELRFKEISHMHQLKTHNGLLHAVSTGNDTVVRINSDHKVVEVTELKAIGDRINRFAITETRDWGSDKTHMNSIGWNNRGEEYHVYMNMRMVYNWTKKKVVLQGGPIHSPHDIEFLDSGPFIVSSSTDRATYFYNEANSEIRCINKVMWRNEDNNEPGVADYGFTRGIAVSGSQVFCCSAPGLIRELSTERFFPLVKEVEITQDRLETIYDITLDPRDW